MKLRALCIDCDDSTLTGLVGKGLGTARAEFGYRTGQRQSHFAPHEFDFIVIDLRSPACFDSRDWGPGRNSNFQCRVLPKEELSTSAVLSGDKLLMQHRLIQSSQVGPVLPGTFGPSDVLRAVQVAGVPVLMFLNQEWLSRAGTEFPNYCDLSWELARTAALKVELKPLLAEMLPELGTTIKLQLALHHSLHKGPAAKTSNLRQAIYSEQLITNTVGDVFAQVCFTGNGSIWLIPGTHDNVGLVAHFSSQLESIRLRTKEYQDTKQSMSKKRIDTLRSAITGNKTSDTDTFWKILHPLVTEVAKPRFESRHYADSVESALKELNDVVKKEVFNRTGKDLDGKELMEFAFSANSTVLPLGDKTTLTGKSLQVGYMQLFAGSMTGVRNPKAHSNVDISAEQAIHFLHLASLLFFKLEESLQILEGKRPLPR